MKTEKIIPKSTKQTIELKSFAWANDEKEFARNTQCPMAVIALPHRKLPTLLTWPFPSSILRKIVSAENSSLDNFDCTIDGYRIQITKQP